MNPNSFSLSDRFSKAVLDQTNPAVDAEKLRLNAVLEQKFKSFSPQRQARYMAFYKADFQSRQLLVDAMLSEQNHEYQQKLLGPKLRHCSTRTKQYCLDWFRNENNIAYREDAISLYESRIAVEEELTYMFESFDENLRGKYSPFYEEEYDGKTRILEKMSEEKTKTEKIAAKLLEQKNNLQKEISTAQKQFGISVQESNHLSLKLSAITSADQLQELKKEFEKIQAARQKNLERLKEKAAPRELKSLREDLAKIDLQEQEKFLKKITPQKPLPQKKSHKTKSQIDLGTELLNRFKSQSFSSELSNEIQKPGQSSDKIAILKSKIIKKMEETARNLKKELSPSDQTIIKKAAEIFLKEISPQQKNI